MKVLVSARRYFYWLALSLIALAELDDASLAQETEPGAIAIREDAEPMRTGKFAPSWESLKQYDVPE
jgi:hypothetical protein